MLGRRFSIRKYAKRPLVIHAMQWCIDDTDAVLDVFPEVGVERNEHGAYRLSVPTMEGVMYASEGDYLIRGIQCEVYPCKPDIFEATYDLVSD